LGPHQTFNGALTISTPSIIFNSSTFQAVTVTKTGSAIDNSRGGNTFNGIMTVNNQGGDFMMGSNAADAGDTWNANAIFNNTGGYRIRVGEDNAGNIFRPMQLLLIPAQPIFRAEFRSAGLEQPA
jgi:hypothetical protein